MEKYKNKSKKHIISQEIKDYLNNIKRLEVKIYISMIEELPLENKLRVYTKITNEVFDIDLIINLNLNKKRIIKQDDIKITYLIYKNNIITSNKTIFNLIKRKLNKEEIERIIMKKFEKIKS